MIEPQPLRPVERSEEDAVEGVLRLHIAGRIRTVPVLKRRQSREWKAGQLARVSGLDIADVPDVGAFMTNLSAVADDAIFEAVLAYDVTGALGGREWLDEHATDRDLFDALEEMVAATFPFAGESPLRSAVAAYGDQIKGVIQLRLAVYAVRLTQEISPTGSPSPTDGDPPTSTTSPTSSTSSTGPTDRTPRNAKRGTGST